MGKGYYQNALNDVKIVDKNQDIVLNEQALTRVLIVVLHYSEWDTARIFPSTIHYHL